MELLSITGKTKIVGIIGDPIEHTFSPAMHNAAFAHLKLPYVYVPFHVKPADLKKAVEGLKKLGVSGVNVTVPHKEAAFRLCDEVSQEAKFTGAVNVLTFRASGKIIGDNTDVYGFSQSLKEAKISLRGKKVAILGAGGAARACAIVCARSGAKEILFFNRTLGKAKKLVRDIKAKTAFHFVSAYTLHALDGVGRVDVLIQTTSVGLHPHSDALPAFADHIPHADAAVDVLYRPHQTLFLQLAKKRGAKKTLGGLSMLLHQGAKAFELWTGKKAPVDVMQRALLEQLKK